MPEFLLLPSVRDGRPASSDLQVKRAQLEKLDALQIVEPSCPVRFNRYAGVSCLEAGERGAPAFLYGHGGGFRMGRAKLWRGLATRLAKATGRRVIVPDYRLAPEHPFPGALYDLASIYLELARDGPPVLLGGDSAGGGLSLSLALLAARSAAPSPAGVVLVSPWLDLTLRSQTFETHAQTGMHFPRQAAIEAAEAYLQGWAAEDALASPLLGSEAVAAPILVFVSAAETLLGDALALVERQGRAGKAIEAVIEPALPHVWPMLMPDHQATKRLLERIGAFSATAEGI